MVKNIYKRLPSCACPASRYLSCIGELAQAYSSSVVPETAVSEHRFRSTELQRGGQDFVGHVWRNCLGDLSLQNSFATCSIESE